ncbi:hypothetical protein U9M48_043507 [Paspalum notatum var. saurae]|uniref:Uncharacterized protein n=1 Tax=Paspalum notatum var. saurae TaxID=547442 RepID=A0AAQ3XIN5_PASNO
MEIDSLRQEIQKRDDVCHAKGCTGTSTATVENVCSDEFFSSTSGIGSAGVQSLPNSSTILRTTWRSAIWTDIDPPLGDFVNNLFASGGTGHNSNKLGAIK